MQDFVFLEGQLQIWSETQYIRRKLLFIYLPINLPQISTVSRIPIQLESH